MRSVPWPKRPCAVKVGPVGHLFVAHGDLTKLACNALLIPCDSEGNVNKAWRTILPKDLRPSKRYPGWLALDRRPNDAGVIDLPTVDGRGLWAFASVDVNGETTPEQVVARTSKAIEHVCQHVPDQDDRATPLIGIPLVGTGHGGLDARRAEVIEKLLKRCRAMPLSADIALILFDRRDFAAVQERRETTDWADLRSALHPHADRLGKLAARGELSLFLGAGVSKPVGLPDWWDLLTALAVEAKCDLPSRRGNPFKAAAPIKKALGDKYSKAISHQLRRRKHGIGHALLASLGAKRMVTTNFDRCMEIALKAPVGKDFRVLTRQLARGGSSWLLKLNGDVQDPATIVLTDSDLKRHPYERRALEGVVQSLLLTSHLFFVGFSFTDKNFLKLASAVSNVRSRARDKDSSQPGTALALTADEGNRVRYKDLHMLSMDETSPKAGARLLEIFLDRLVWTAATQGNLASEYLLDPRYESGLSECDAALRTLLVTMSDEASKKAKSSSGWKRVDACLRDLGAD
jgi:hypothetical protein